MYKCSSGPFTVTQTDAYFLIGNFGCALKIDKKGKATKTIVPDNERFALQSEYMAKCCYDEKTHSMKLPLGRIAWSALSNPASAGGLCQYSIGEAWSLEAIKRQNAVIVDDDKTESCFDGIDGYKDKVKLGRQLVAQLSSNAGEIIDDYAARTSSHKPRKQTAFSDIDVRLIEFSLSKQMPKMIEDISEFVSPPPQVKKELVF